MFPSMATASPNPLFSALVKGPLVKVHSKLGPGGGGSTGGGVGGVKMGMLVGGLVMGALVGGAVGLLVVIAAVGLLVKDKVGRPVV